ncbi:hypothetical protein [Bradyrhizobium sp. DASA03120]|uniref:hypothetical protein n=1 Tax=Bradyrhizobium sp. SMVTL-02 TaxID=3395917 RepID=UPI003F6ECEFB
MSKPVVALPRLISCDEAGFTGNNLLDPDQPMFSYASHDLTLAEADSWTDGGPFKFSQIKKTCGTVRVYWDGALSPEAGTQVEEAIALAEARSAVTCEVCGEEGRLPRRRRADDPL